MLALTWPGETWLHRVPVGVKLLALCAVTLVLFGLVSGAAMGLALAGVLALTASGGRGFLGRALWALWPLWPFLLLLGAYHLVTSDLATGAVIGMRILTAVAAANLVTMTSRLNDLIAVVERLARPLRWVGLPPRRLGLAIALVIRFLPVMLAHRAFLADAWAARSPRRAGWRIVVPLALAALDEADHVAEALRARGGAG